MTIGGLIQVAAHGTGISIPSMDETVRELKMVLANGNVVTLDPNDGDKFSAAKVALGCMGAVVEVRAKNP